MRALRRLSGLAIRKLFLTVLTLVFVSVVIYAATLVVPADPARVFLGKTASPEQLQAFREEQGLDRNAVDGYFYWAGRFARGDWGDSIVSREPVTDLVFPRLARTMVLALFAFVIAAPASLLFGLMTGRRAGSRLDLSSP